MTGVVKFAYMQRFLLRGPGDFKKVVQFSTDELTDEGRRNRDLMLESHLSGLPLNMTEDGTDDGISLKGVMVQAFHSQVYRVDEGIPTVEQVSDDDS